MCTPWKVELQFEHGIRQDSISLIPRVHANPRSNQTPKTPGETSAGVREQSKEGDNLHNKKEHRGKAIDSSRQQQVKQDKADTEEPLNMQHATKPCPSADRAKNKTETNTKLTWLRNWLDKVPIAMPPNILTTPPPSDPSPQTANNVNLSRTLSFRQNQKKICGPISANNKVSGAPSAQTVNNKNPSRTLSFRRTEQPNCPEISASSDKSPDIPNTSHDVAPPLHDSNSEISCENNEPTLGVRRKRSSLTVHWRDATESSASKPLLLDQEKNSDRRDSAGVCNEAMNDDDEHDEEWYDTDGPDRFLLENWNLQYRVLVEDWQGN